MTSTVENTRALEQCTNVKFAIFIKPSNGQRYAFNCNGLNHHTFKEVGGKWEKVDCLYAWAVWNANFQGFDDITSLIVE